MQTTRELLQLRNERTSQALHSRFSSFSGTERSDSPSLYSRHDLSPRSPTYEDTDSEYFQPSGHAISPPLSALRPSPDDDDSTLLVHEAAANSSSEQEDRLDGDASSTPEEDDSDSRMSMLGPKMKFVSRAPWEAGPNGELPEEEKDSIAPAEALSIFGNRKGSRGRSRTAGAKDKENAIARGLGLVAFASSPRSPSAARPSFDSQSLSLRKKSSDTTSSFTHAGPHAISSSASTSSKLTTKLSMPRLRTQSSGARASGLSLSSSSSDVDPMHHPPLPSPRSVMYSEAPAVSSSRNAQGTYATSPTNVETLSRCETPPPRGYIHPYANPDLLPSCLAQNHAEKTSASKKSEDLQSLSPSASAASPNVLAASPSGGLMQQGSTSPISPIGSNSSLPAGMMAWGDFPRSPTYSLISLEQAQQRVRDRAGAPVPPVPERSRVPSSSKDAQGNPYPSPQASPNTQVDAAVQGPSPARTIRPKRSGFMKIFNGKDKPERSHTPPPLPTISVPTPIIPPTPRVPPQYAKVVPPPPAPIISPVPKDPSSIARRSPSVNLSITVTSPKPAPVHRPVPRPVRKPPPVPFPSAPEAAEPTPSLPSRHATEPTPLPNRHAIEPTPLPSRHATEPTPSLTPLSAPASVNAFPTLSLRPMSGLFSNAMPLDLLATPHSPTSSVTPSLPSVPLPSSCSPTTPVFDPSSRSASISTGSAEDPYPLTPSAVDSAAILSVLQEQRSGWQKQIQALEAQVRLLQTEVEQLRSAQRTCDVCSAELSTLSLDTVATKTGVVDRPRARTGGGNRTTFASGWEGD